jgi:hypothetical protein
MTGIVIQILQMIVFRIVLVYGVEMHSLIIADIVMVIMFHVQIVMEI